MQHLPRRCPVCGNRTIIGHGRRRKQAHDRRHDWIWIRRGLCRACRKTFTILPAWSPPYGHYSLHCRQQAWESLREAASWEDSVPDTKKPDRLFCFGVCLASSDAQWSICRVLTVAPGGTRGSRYYRLPHGLANLQVTHCRAGAVRDQVRDGSRPVDLAIMSDITAARRNYSPSVVERRSAGLGPPSLM